MNIVPLAPLCVEPHTEYATLGRVVFREGSRLVAVGVVKGVSAGKAGKIPKLEKVMPAFD